MKSKTVPSFGTVSRWNYAIATTVYATIGLSGYALFGSTLGGNVLSSFEHSSDALIGVVTACFLFVAVFSVPISNFSLRISLHFMLFGETRASELQHVLETVVPIGGALIVAMFVSNVATVFSFTGAVTSSATSFIIPCVLFLRCTKLSDRSHRDVVTAWTILGLGLTIATIGLASAIHLAI